MDLFEVMGSYGAWQKRILPVFFAINTIGMWQSLSITFLAPNVHFWCVDPIPLNGSSDQCDVIATNTTHESVPCRRWDYDTSHYSETIVSEWDLVCDREWMVSLAKSIYMVGFLFSVIVFGQISDCLGRFPTVVMTHCITCAAMLLSVFSTSYSMFFLLRFFLAFGRGGLVAVGYVLIMEIVGPKHRTGVGIAVQLGWSMGFMTLPLIAWFVRHWIWFQVAISAPMFLIFFTYGIIPESPRWLLMRGKTKKLEELLRKAASANKVELKVDIRDFEGLKMQEVTKRKTLLDILKMRKMRNRTIILIYIWAVNSFIYYGLSFNTNDLAGNPYLNFFVYGALEFPAYALLFWASRRFGRRPTLVAFSMACGAACIAAVPLPQGYSWLATTFSMAGKFFVKGSYGLLYLYTSELYPTVVRSVALGTCSMFARVGAISAPFVKELGKVTAPSVPYVLYMLLSVTTGLLALLLPETLGRKMPDTLEDGERMGEQENTTWTRYGTDDGYEDFPSIERKKDEVHRFYSKESSKL